MHATSNHGDAMRISEAELLNGNTHGAYESDDADDVHVCWLVLLVITYHFFIVLLSTLFQCPNPKPETVEKSASAL